MIMSTDQYNDRDFNTDYLLNSISIPTEDEYDNYTKFNTTRLISLAKAKYHNNELFNKQINMNSKTVEASSLYGDFYNGEQQGNKVDSIFRSHTARQEGIQYIDSRTNEPVPSQYIRDNFFLKFQKKDFHCKFTFINEINMKDQPTIHKIFVPKKEDYMYFKDVSKIIDKVMQFYKFTKYREFPFVFYNYCVVLMKSGYDPVQDFLISYVIKYLDVVLNSKNKSNVIDVKVRLIARIFSLKNIKVNNFYNKDDLMEKNEIEDSLLRNKGEFDSTIRNELVHENNFDERHLENSWVFDDKFSISSLNDENFNLFISRAIRYSIFLYWQRRKLVKRSFVTWYKKAELMRRERFLYMTWNKYICKKILVNKFHEKYIRHQRRHVMAANHHTHNLKTAMFEKWKSKLQMIYENKNRVEVQYKLKYFTKFVKKHEKIIKLEAESALMNNNRLITTTFHSWKKKYIYMAKKRLFEYKKKRSLVKDCILKWKEKLELYGKYEALSKKFESGVKCGSIFIDWRNQVILNQEEYLGNIAVINSRVKRRYFDNWKKSSLLKSRLYLFKEEQEEIMKKFLFKEKWMKGFNYLYEADKFIHEKNMKELTKYFNSWKNITEINLKASNFRINKLLSDNFLQLKRNSYCKMVDRFCDYKLAKKFIRVWIRNIFLNEYSNHFNRKLVNKAFEAWKISYSESLNDYLNAVIFYDNKLKRKAFKDWNIITAHWKDLLTDADIYFRNSKLKNNFIKGLKSKIFKQRTLEKKMKNLIDLNLKKISFNIIVNCSNKHREIRLTEGYNHLMGKRDNRLKVNIFLRWIDKYNSDIEDETRCDEYIKKKFFQKYVYRHASVQNFMATAGLHYEAYIFKKYLYALISKSNYYFDIRIAEENFKQEKDFKVVESIWTVWDMKLMKVKQMNESLKLFKNKWEKAATKQILQLWILKYNEKNFNKSYQDILDSLDEDSLSVLSNRKNISPVKSFNRNVQKQLIEQKGNEKENTEQLLDYYNNSYDLDTSPLIDKKKRENYIRNNTNTRGKHSMLSSTPAAKAKSINFSNSEEANYMDYEIETNSNYNTPSKSRIINMSAIGSTDGSNFRSVHIRNKRLESLKKYYNRQPI